MSCDQTRINNIESLLKSSSNNISDSDLIYYLQCKSNNKVLDSNNLTKTEDYLKKINNSFIYENIFTNTSNYSAVVPLIIGCLLPFYYFYPRFYKLGFIGFSIGLSTPSLAAARGTLFCCKNVLRLTLPNEFFCFLILRKLIFIFLQTCIKIK